MVSRALRIIPVGKRIHIDFAFNVATFGSLNSWRFGHWPARHSTAYWFVLEPNIWFQVFDGNILPGLGNDKR